MPQRSLFTFVAVIAALLLAGMTFGASLWLLAAYAGVLMIGTGFWFASQWHGAAVAVRHDGAIELEVGQSTEIVVDITNRSRLPIAWLLVEDLLPKAAFAQRPPALRIDGSRIEVFYLPAGQTRQLRYRITCQRRGYYQIGPTVLETGDLMGLSRRYRVGAPPQYILVYPRSVPMAGYDIASPRPIGEIRIRNAVMQDPTRIRGIRKWQIGDPLRSVHWAATARTGTLHSKVYEPTSLAGATLILDMHRDTNPDQNEPVRSDLAVSLAASIAAAFYEMNQPIALLSNGRDAADRIRTEGFDTDFRTRGAAQSEAAMRERDDRLRPVIVDADRGPVHFQELRRVLARLELSDGLSIAETVVNAQQRLAHDTTLIVITQKCDRQTAAMLIGMRRRGWAVAVVINTADTNDFAASAGPLQSDGIETIHLIDETQLPHTTRRIRSR
ncbi:MAG TPA: DUF58 domain-containing protein [Planctomycetaceae bacterium]|nr:DUF58 domain-containing protein [Planctomycetaceae bacterium]